MALILHIDTALETASVCLSDDENIIALAINTDQKDHASWLHNSIREMMIKHDTPLNRLQAISVSIGPGSYTGLRVGLSAAKGFCYALNIPLITTGTLQMIANRVRKEATDLICPLIDARRMEVYAALYDKQMTEIEKPSALTVDANSFSDLLTNRKLIFTGSGSKKLQQILSHANASFIDKVVTAEQLVVFAHLSYRKQQFADLAYTEPLYIKDFYSPARKPLV
ncbi:MAG: tRNA (adenosine(37)-N6)-threonylcarbamoyltransferase complex dimerization subunit type 1 TsaB [Chitinophagales bacterium]|nr:tRNA (adenosine(37)-N6)-threonylcarbamoyltransferase complex dimerization subunit type 1 TsaB [Chitinophagales bacterium]